MESVWWRLNMQIHGGWLTNFSLEKMAAISQMIFSDAFLSMTNFCILIIISLKFVPKGPINNSPALV